MMQTPVNLTKCKHKVINFMPGQSDDIDKGGTFRLGAYPCSIKSGTAMDRCYGTLTQSANGTGIAMNLITITGKLSKKTD